MKSAPYRKRKPNRITVSVISNITTDQRVIRVCSTLQALGFSVTVFYRRLPGSLPPGTYPFRIRAIPCRFRRGIAQYVEFTGKLLVVLLFSRTRYFLANDLDTLLPNFVVSRLRGKKLFYDTHEYFTGVAELNDSPGKRRAWKWLENRLFPRLSTVYTVNESVQRQYQQEYGVPVSVVRNVPVSARPAPRELPSGWKGKIILLMQGAGINAGRGGLELLESLLFLPEEYYVVFIGGGTQWPVIARKRLEWGLETRSEMIPTLPPEELRTYTPLAHIGYNLDNFTDLNCRFNLANRIFDYLHAGVPLLATGIPEVRRLIEQYQCGICIDLLDPREVARATLELMENQDLYNSLKNNAKMAAMALCWEKEQEKLKAIYTPYL
ncbi:MAG TPA: glycosyltransferase [Chitinophagaceae bacterium]|nr:glycosyltransferase [Chitinophagaceae bacterium]